MKPRLKAARPRAAALKAVPVKQRTVDKPSFFSPDDPDGSYTGAPADGGAPVQDADDL